MTNAVGQVLGTDTERVVVGMGIDLAATFSDPGELDTHSATIAWGDQSPDTTFDPATSPLDASHSFTQVGSFTVVLSVTDRDGASTTHSTVVAVVEPLTAIGDVVADLAELESEQPDQALEAALDHLRGDNGGAADNGALDLLEEDPSAALVKLAKALEALAAAPESETVAAAEQVLTYVAWAVAVEYQAQAIAALGDNPSKGEQKQLDQIAADIAAGDGLLASGEHVAAVEAYAGALNRALDLLAG